MRRQHLTPTAIELFAGCGGLSTGLLDAGIRVLLGTDYYAPAMHAYKYNHAYRGSQALTADIRSLKGQVLLDMIGLRPGQLSLIAGGPPCQPFSIIGKRQGLADVRGDLVFEFIRIVREALPAAFIFENVANLSTVANGEVLAVLLEQMEKAGYATSTAILNAADYGVAQMRKRLIIVGVRGQTPLPFPPIPTHGQRALLGEQPYRTSRDVLDDLPDVNEKAAHFIPNHEPTEHSPGMLEVFRQLAPGTRDPKSHHDRLHPDRPSYTLRAGTGNFSPLRPIHYRHDRVISVRESARIQGFADEFIWPYSLPRLQQYRQVGNAVPPPLAQVVAKHVASRLGWLLDAERTRGDLSQRELLLPPPAEERQRQRRKLIRGASVGRA
jgi:DNA (cytosine-5)-methyltransferase 1